MPTVDAWAVLKVVWKDRTWVVETVEPKVGPRAFLRVEMLAVSTVGA